MHSDFLFTAFENLYSPYNGSIIHNRKIDVKKLKYKQNDYDNRYQLLNGKVIQKTLTSHKFFNKFIFSFHLLQNSVYCTQLLTKTWKLMS